MNLPIYLGLGVYRSLRLPSHTSMSTNTSWVTFVASRGDAVRELEAIADLAMCRLLGFRRESTANQIGECVDGLFFVRTARFDGDRAADPRSEQHDSDDIACIDSASLYSEPDAAGEPRGKLHNLGRWARVNPQRVGDFELNFLHRMEIG
jgi:hypothetical protein